jgi:hypothetical protein
MSMTARLAPTNNSIAVNPLPFILCGSRRLEVHIKPPP